jgi:hypothetical protein
MEKLGYMLQRYQAGHRSLSNLSNSAVQQARFSYPLFFEGYTGQKIGDKN